MEKWTKYKNPDNFIYLLFIYNKSVTNCLRHFVDLIATNLTIPRPSVTTFTFNTIALQKRTAQSPSKEINQFLKFILNGSFPSV